MGRSVLADSTRDLDRAADHIERAMERVKWIHNAYQSHPDVQEQIVTLVATLATTKEFIDNIHDTIRSK